jgi:hypothetical protein
MAPGGVYDQAGRSPGTIVVPIAFCAVGIKNYDGFVEGSVPELTRRSATLFESLV